MTTKKELVAKYTDITGLPVPTKWNKSQLEAEIAVAQSARNEDFFSIPEALRRTDDAPSVTPTPAPATDASDADPRSDDAPETEDDDERGPRTVVKEAYRAEYRKRTKKGTHCNDYLAQMLEDVFVDGKKFDTDTFTLCLAANNVPLVGKWAALPSSGQKGWQGRYRMNGRLQLERIVVATARIVMPDGDGGYVTEQVDDVEWLLARASKLNVDCEWEINDEGNIERLA